MSLRNFLLLFGGLIAAAGLLLAAYTRDRWQGYLFPASAAQAAEEEHHEDEDRLHLTPQAQRTLGLRVRPAPLGSHWRTLRVPATVVERPGHGDQALNTPLAGVIERIVAIPGEVVRPGQELFTVRLVSEYLQNSQTELYKAVREIQINQEWKQRLQRASGAIPETRLLEVENEIRRLEAREKALRFDLKARGLTPEQIDDVAQGDFVTSLVLRAPEPAAHPGDSAADSAALFEMEELKVKVGDPVEPGQALAILARHSRLLLEARVYKHELPLLRKAAREDWPLDADFPEEAGEDWPPVGPLKILSFGNRVDVESQTIPVFVPLPNQYREHSAAGQTFRTWRFRPDQRLHLRVPVERFTDVFVLPAEAVAREGAENYVFVQNGSVFDRTPVTVLHRDPESVVLANDGSITPAHHVVLNNAAQLLRALQLKASGGGGHDHHHGHEH